MADMTVATTAGGKTILKETAVATFKSRLRGELLGVDDNGYEDARKVTLTFSFQLRKGNVVESMLFGDRHRTYYPKCE